jgi:hypothetical protein
MSAKCGHRLFIVNGYDSTAIDRFSANPNYLQTGCRTNQDGHNQVHARCANCQSIFAVKVPSAVQHGLTAATDSAPKTTSTIAITAHTKPTLTKKLAKSDEESKPLTNVVRDSEKAVPQSIGGGSTPTSHADPVATVDKPTTGEQQETAQEEPSQSGATSGQQSATSGAAARTQASPEAGTVECMAAPSDRNYWNHNTAYHPWLVAIAAEHRGDVLDVGCGDVLPAQRLAPVSPSVTGSDSDPAAVGCAANRVAPHRHITVSRQDFQGLPTRRAPVRPHYVRSQPAQHGSSGLACQRTRFVDADGRDRGGRNFSQ